MTLPVLGWGAVTLRRAERQLAYRVRFSHGSGFSGRGEEEVGKRTGDSRERETMSMCDQKKLGQEFWVAVQR